MKKLILIPLAALAACMNTDARDLELSAEAEARLAEELAGKVAGEPVSCVSLRNLGSNRSIGDELVIFEERIGDTIWVNRPPAGCPDLGFSRALRVETTMSQLCRGDIVTVFDPVTGVNFGGCSLGDFVPYRPAG